MSGAVVVTRPLRSDGVSYVAAYIWCPGCDDLHRALVDGPPDQIWTWNGDVDRPIFDPSLLVEYGNQPGSRRCHSFIRNGQWEFLGDSTHQLAGQTVPVVPMPDGWP